VVAIPVAAEVPTQTPCDSHYFQSAYLPVCRTGLIVFCRVGVRVTYSNLPFLHILPSAYIRKMTAYEGVELIGEDLIEHL